MTSLYLKIEIALSFQLFNYLYRMNNNDIFRRLQYTFNSSNEELIACFAAADARVNQHSISQWLRAETKEGYQDMPDEQLALYLNGLINIKRGKREGKPMPVEKELNNNIVFRKLRIALNYTDKDILQILLLADFQLGKHELSAFFRKPTQKQYRECLDQVLRRFLHGLQLHFRKKQALPELPKPTVWKNIKSSSLKK